MFPAFLIQILVVLLVVGLLLWGLSQFPIDPTIARLIRVVIIVFVVIWLIYLLLGSGVIGSGGPVLYRHP